jgi:hypothetical protein
MPLQTLLTILMAQAGKIFFFHILRSILTFNRLHTHWQWVVMIVVLAVAFLLLGVIGTIVHKRYTRRREYGDSTAPMTSNPQVNTWVPSQHSVHDFGNQNQSPAPAPASAPTPPAAGSSRGLNNNTPVRAPSRRLTKTPIGVAR